MPLIVDFLNEFRECLLDGNEDNILEMNMPDDITGWGVTESDDFNSLSDLYRQSKRYYDERESAEIQLEPIDSFGNDRAMVVACRYRRAVQCKNGLILNDDDLRLTLYLIKHQGQLKIRHGHLSKAWPEATPFPTKSIPNNRPQPENPARLDPVSIAPFMDLLNQRATCSQSADLLGLESLQHPGESRVYFPMDKTEGLRGIRQYTQYMRTLAEKHLHPFLKYHHPVAFLDQSLACLTACAECGWQEKATGEKIRVSPMRVTYILQEHKGQWLSRHTHWSIPQPDAT